MANKVIGHIPYGLGLRLVNPSEKESQKVVVATAQQIEVIDLPLLAKHVKEHGTPFSEGTIYGVLTDAVACVIEMLRAGYGVKLDGLGKFGVSLQSTGTEDANDFTAANITGVNLTFQADENVKTALNTNMEFDYVGSRKQQAAAKKAEKEALASGASTTGGSGSSGSGDTGGSGSGDPGDVTP